MSALLFVAPLFKIEGFDRDGQTSIESVYMLFFNTAEGRISPSSLLSFEITRNCNAITLIFSNLSVAKDACAHINSVFPMLSTKMKVLPTDSRIEVPIHHTDPSAPSGLHVIEDWLSLDDERQIVDDIDSRPWDTTIRRRVQHYGFQFKYSQLTVDSDRPVNDFPSLIKSHVLYRPELCSFGFDQLTINEYLPGVGIASHCDTHSAFIETIAVVSLINPVTMDFVNHDNSRRVSLVIPPRSLYLMTGDSRFGWRHAIANRKTDVNLDGEVHPRLRRISLTFRKIFQHECKCTFSSLCDSQGADALRPRRMQSG